MSDTRLDFSRQASLVKNPEGLRVLIIGVGGIGSNVAYTLASMGVKQITMYDPDLVGIENVAPGFFTVSQAERSIPKVEAVRDNIAYMLGDNAASEIKMVFERFADQEEEVDVVIIGTDSAASRKEAYFKKSARYRYWIDARMGGFTAQVTSFSVENTRRVQDYERELLRLRENEAPCGEKSTAGITKGVIPGLIFQLIVPILNGDDSNVLFEQEVTCAPFSVSTSVI